MEFTAREQIVEVVNKLFIFTDSQYWNRLQEEVFAEEVSLDMSSLEGPNRSMTSRAICDMWEEGFKELDAVNHLGGNYLVDFENERSASVFAYATATHYKADTAKGQTREFVGTYDLKLFRAANGWRITALKYELKYMSGNIDLD